MRIRFAGGWTIIALAGLLCGPPAAHAFGPGATFLLSRPSGVGALPQGGDNSSFATQHALSADGRYVVFQSLADDLGVADQGEHIYLRDTQANTTTLIDRSVPGGVAADQESESPAISGNGNTVCFVSSADNLVPGVTDGNEHLYVVTLSSGAVTGIAVADRASGNPGALANEGTDFGSSCSLDQSGTNVVFGSEASNLDTGITGHGNGAAHVYVRNLSTHTTTLVDESGGTATDDGAADPVVATDPSSPNHTFVAFDTPDVLAAPDAGSHDDVYVSDITAAGTPVLVSRPDGSGATAANGDSDSPSISDDANTIAFESTATNLGDGDSDTAADIHVRDIGAATTTLASRADTGDGNAKSNGSSFAPALSGDGVKVAFGSSADNLGSTPPAESDEIYVRNLNTDATATASRATGSAGAIDNSGAAFASLDDNGNVIAWYSQGSNLDPAASGEFSEVFRRVRTTPFTTSLVSRPSGTDARSSAVNGSNEGDSLRTISADGRYVVFYSGADAIDPLSTGPVFNVFVRDTLAGTTTLVSRAAGADGAVGNNSSTFAAISADGTKVAFYSQATNLIPGVPAGEIYERDLASGALTLVSRADGASGAPVAHLFPNGALNLSADGSKVVFSASDDGLVPTDNNHAADVFVRDVNAGTTTIASVTNSGGISNGTSTVGAISSDGTRVAFVSTATNMGDGVTDNHNHVHLRDLMAGTTTLIDRADGAAGAPAALDSYSPSISADGNRVAFESSSALTSDAGAVHGQSYVRDVAAGTTTLVSRADGAAGAPIGGQTNPGVEVPQISYDGTTASFNGIVSGTVGAYERNLAAGTTTLTGAVDGTPGTAGDASTHNGALDVDGSCAVLVSTADNLASPGYGTRDFNQVYGHVLSRECPLVAPDTVIDSAPSGTIKVPTATFAFHSSEDGSTFSCQLDAGAFAPCTSALTTPALADGPHHFAVRATDAANNTDATPALADFTVEVAPVFSAVSMLHSTFKAAGAPTAVSASTHKPKHKKKKHKTPNGTAFRYTLSESATVRIEIEKLTKGRRKTSKSSSSCVKKTHKNRKHKSCTRHTVELTLKRSNQKAGKHSTSFSGVWRSGKHHTKHRLGSGSYEAKLGATDPSGNKSSTKTVKFKVVKK